MKVKKKSFFDLYHKSLEKLLQQHDDWFMRRVEFAKKGDLGKVAEIEKRYLEPLETKINKLARIAKEEVDNGDK